MATNRTPLNTFRTLTRVITNEIYSFPPVPVGITRIVLGAQVSNLTSDMLNITFSLVKDSVEYTLLKDFTVPHNDAVDITTGKLVLETGIVIKIVTDSTESNAAHLILSVLDTSNE